MNITVKLNMSMNVSTALDVSEFLYLEIRLVRFFFNGITPLVVIDE